MIFAEKAAWVGGWMDSGVQFGGIMYRDSLKGLPWVARIETESYVSGRLDVFWKADLLAAITFSP